MNYISCANQHKDQVRQALQANLHRRVEAEEELIRDYQGILPILASCYLFIWFAGLMTAFGGAIGAPDSVFAPRLVLAFVFYVFVLSAVMWLMFHYDEKKQDAQNRRNHLTWRYNRLAAVV